MAVAHPCLFTGSARIGRGSRLCRVLGTEFTSSLRSRLSASYSRHSGSSSLSLFIVFNCCFIQRRPAGVLMRCRRWIGQIPGTFNTTQPADYVSQVQQGLQEPQLPQHTHHAEARGIQSGTFSCCFLFFLSCFSLFYCTVFFSIQSSCPPRCVVFPTWTFVSLMLRVGKCMPTLQQGVPDKRQPDETHRKEAPRQQELPLHRAWSTLPSPSNSSSLLYFVPVTLLCCAYWCNSKGCGRVFPTAKERQDHIARHEKGRKFICEYPGCPQGYSTVSNSHSHSASRASRTHHLSRRTA